MVWKMAFYDELGKKISKTGQGAIQKTKEFAEITRLNSSISELEKGIVATYTEIGRSYFQKYAQALPDEEFAVLFNRIEESMRQIEANKNQIRILKGVVPCPNCGMDVDANAAFCKSCGSRLIPVAQMTYSGNVCSECGSPVEEGQLFCTRCGHKMEQQTQESSMPVDEEKQFCRECGAELQAGAMFCMSCGTKVESQENQNIEQEQSVLQPQNVEWGEETTDFAGEQEEKKCCPECGTSVEHDMLFCVNCGHRF